MVILYINGRRQGNVFLLEIDSFVEQTLFLVITLALLPTTLILQLDIYSFPSLALNQSLIHALNSFTLFLLLLPQEYLAVS